MINIPTVLVLGAGASNPYGFPLGIGLRDSVCGMMGPEIIGAPGPLIDDEPREPGVLDELGELTDFVSALRNSGYTSVDWFLEDNPQFIEVGKRSIASALIPFEDPGKLFPPNASNEHWYELLINVLDSPRGAFAENPLSIVTFNYDRSLEFYLLRVLETRRSSLEQAIEELRTLDVIHVHGALGDLAPMVTGGREYSPELEPEIIRAAADQIVVVGEVPDDAEAFAVAADVLAKAERIVFLGFGFHPASVERLGVFNEPWTEERRQRVRVGGTSRGMPEHRWADIRENVLNQAIPPRHRRTADTVFRYLNEREPLE